MYIAFKGEPLFIKNEPLYYIKVSRLRTVAHLASFHYEGVYLNINYATMVDCDTKIKTFTKCIQLSNFMLSVGWGG